MSGASRERRRLRWKVWARSSTSTWPGRDALLAGPADPRRRRQQGHGQVRAMARVPGARRRHYRNTSGIIGAALYAAEPAGGSTRRLSAARSTMQVHLLDATYELFRSHFAPRPHRLDRDGQSDQRDGRHHREHPLSAARGGRDSSRVAPRTTSSSRGATRARPGYKTGVGVDPCSSASSPRARKRCRRWAWSSGRWSSGRPTTGWARRRPLCRCAGGRAGR